MGEKRYTMMRTIEVLKAGGVVALPTDTVYGIVATLENAEKLYLIKARCHRKPLALFASGEADILKFCKDVDFRLLHRLLPGPVTVIYERSEQLLETFNPGQRNVGVRISDSYFLQHLMANLGVPLAQTSANLAGTKSSLCPEEFRDLWPHLDLIIDGGKIKDNNGKARKGSTVVNLTVPGTYSIIRDGCARVETEEILRDFGLTALSDTNVPTCQTNIAHQDCAIHQVKQQF